MYVSCLSYLVLFQSGFFFSYSCNLTIFCSYSPFCSTELSFLISHSNMCLFFLVDWIESGMESDVAPDEMYLMLQADMVSRYLDVYIFIPVESCLKMN